MLVPSREHFECYLWENDIVPNASRCYIRQLAGHVMPRFVA